MVEQLKGHDFSTELRNEFGEPEFNEDHIPNLHARFAKSYEAYIAKHFKGGEGEENKEAEEKRRRTVVILVSHGASIDSWGRYWKDKNYKG